MIDSREPALSSGWSLKALKRGCESFSRVSSVFTFMWTHYDTWHLLRAERSEFRPACCNSSAGTRSGSAVWTQRGGFWNVQRSEMVCRDKEGGGSQTEPAREDATMGPRANKEAGAEEWSEQQGGGGGRQGGSDCH